MAKIWEKFYDEVLPDVPGCPQNVAKNAIRNAAIDFCERSWVYRASHPAINVLATISSYAYTPTDPLTKVAVPISVWYDNKPLHPKSASQLEERYKNWTTETGTPLYFLQESLEALVLCPSPSAALASGITLKVALKPSRAATGLPDELWEKYLETIAIGAKSRLHAMKRKPWTDLVLAAAMASAFIQKSAEAKVAADRGHVRSRARVRAHFF